MQGKVLGIELVGAFKRRCMADMLSQCVRLAAAYGNTLSGTHALEAIIYGWMLLLWLTSVSFRHADVDAYKERLPANRVFTCGPHAGAGGTRRVTDWAAHLEELWAELPEAQPRIPYTNLHF